MLEQASELFIPSTPARVKKAGVSTLRLRNTNDIKNNSFASSTPAVDELHVYTMWHSPEGSPVTAYTHTGQKVWEFDLGPWTQGQGGASSPIVYEEWVFIDNDHREGSMLIALDRKSGREAWRIPRQGERACFTHAVCIRARGTFS